MLNSQQVHERHAHYYAGIARQADQQYQQGGAATATGLKLFDQERGQIDQIWHWISQQPRDEAQDALLLEIAEATAHIGELRYHPRAERIPMLEQRLDAARRAGRPDIEARTLMTLGAIYGFLGVPDQARTLLEQALGRSRNDRRTESHVLQNLGAIHDDLGEPRHAAELYEHALVIARDLGDCRAEASLLNNIGLALFVLGHRARAIQHYDYALQIARAIGAARDEHSALANIGVAHAQASAQH